MLDAGNGKITTMRLILFLQLKQTRIKSCMFRRNFIQNKWINNRNIKEAISFYGNCEYSKYLKSLIN